jgi:ABC-type sugar transport system ATPase subunit
MTMADRIVLLDKGRIQQIGTPKEIYRAPAKKFVASFVGSPEINILSGKITLADGGIRIDGRPLPVSTGRFSALKNRSIDGKAMELGIRPEHLRVAQTASAETLRLKIEAVEFTGQDFIAIGHAGTSRLAIRMDMHSDAELAETLERGMELDVTPVEDQWHLFDPTTGLRETAA